MTTAHYPTVNPNPDFAALEEEVLHFWKENGTFQQSIDQRAGGNGNDYVFYDGPPFANGLPHYGHLLTGYVKDAIARYHTMKGKRVERRFGWDCHGLPAEMGAEKELNITGRAAIMEYGIGKFNDYCRNNVMRYVSDWEYYVGRQGRWVDFKNDYKTMDKDFMESVIWAFSELYKKDYVFEAFRVMPYSWAAETPLSNFETRMDNATREREDKAAYVKFKLKDKPEELSTEENCYIVAWTTTPWTLPSNLALAIGNLEYGYINIRTKDGVKETYIASTPYLPKLAADLDKQGYQVTFAQAAAGEKKDEKLKLIDGAFAKEDLIGLAYEPLFPYFAETKNAFRVIDGGEAVTEGEGTGVIHMAPGFGEVDQKICKENGIEVVVPVDGQGKFTGEIYDLPDLKLQGLIVVPDTRLNAGDIHIADEDRAQHIDVKDVLKYGLANMRIVRWLKAHGKLVKDEPYKHNYPHCWRTDTPVIYRAMSSWYVAVTKFRDRAVELNQQINWIPGHVKDGQMGHMLATAPDWSISRNRFWGTPIPIWRAPSGKMMVPGSIAEIEAWSGKKVEDLHRPFIDAITFERDGETYTRVEDVFDCWFESGSMPYAQLHYPFENKQLFEENFPADFITEYVGQTRGWFNTLIMLSTALFDKPPFKNCICHGVVLDEETGLKYSKRLKNYKDPKEVMDSFGADALRWMMLASPVMRGADIGVDPEGKFIRDVVRLNIKPLWSAYNFFTLYANADGVKAKEIATSENLLDRYILAKAKAAVQAVQASMDAYETTGACDAITGVFDVLNNWYIRRSRARFWADELSADKQAAYDTLYTVLTLLCRASAPLLPFASEMVYRGLVGTDSSVHLTDFPDVSAIDSAEALVADMDRVRDACTSMGSIRSAENIRNRQPLASATLYGSGAERLKPFAALMEDEINVKEIRFADSLEGVAEFTLSIDFKVAGKRLGPKMKAVGVAAKAGDWRRDGAAIIVGGEAMEAGEYTLQLKPLVTKGAQRLASNDAMVVLDLAITPELEAEGRARDLVRMIQQARKDAGLNVADRIALALDIPGDFAAALATHRDYIAQQVLAVSIGEGAAQSEQQLTQELDGAAFVIGISKAA
jgi:isoleucyl-tRNA synthetase